MAYKYIISKCALKLLNTYQTVMITTYSGFICTWYLSKYILVAYCTGWQKNYDQPLFNNDLFIFWYLEKLNVFKSYMF